MSGCFLGISPRFLFVFALIVFPDLVRTGPAWAEESPSGTVSVSGVRVTQGDGVECPRIRDASGREYAVSYLPPSIPIGSPVSVRGPLVILTTCLGKVIHVEELVPGP